MTIQQLTPLESGTLSIQEAIADFTLHQRTSRHTPKTLEYYEWSFGHLTRFLGSEGVQTVGQVDANTLRRFLLHLEGALKPSSVHGTMRAVRALFNFLEREEIILSSPMKRVKMPKLDKTILPAFTPDEIKKLERAVCGSDPTSVRNRALILMLLDSGLRLSEVASLKVGDIDPATGVMKVMGKGRKERVTRIGARALKEFTRYSRIRRGEPGQALWLGKRGAMTPTGIAETLEKLGKKAGVHAHPHKFRRSCALYMLRSGADVFSVQYLLGHADLAVMRRYLAQTESDVTAAHEKHSPVDSLM